MMRGGMGNMNNMMKQMQKMQKGNGKGARRTWRKNS